MASPSYGIDVVALALAVVLAAAIVLLVSHEGQGLGVCVPARDVCVGIRLAPPAPLFAGMPPRRRTSKDSPAELAKRMSRRWRVVLLRHKG